MVKKIKAIKRIKKKPLSKKFIFDDDTSNYSVKSNLRKLAVLIVLITAFAAAQIAVIQPAKKIAKIVGKDITFEMEKHSETSKISNLYADISKAEKLLDWSPKTSLEEGLKKVVESYKAKHKI